MALLRIKFTNVLRCERSYHWTYIINVVFIYLLCISFPCCSPSSSSVGTVITSAAGRPETNDNIGHN